MTHYSRETLNRAAGILEGLSASGDLSTGMTDMILNVAEMIDAVLKEGDERCKSLSKG